MLEGFSSTSSDAFSLRELIQKRDLRQFVCARFCLTARQKRSTDWEETLLSALNLAPLRSKTRVSKNSPPRKPITATGPTNTRSVPPTTEATLPGPPSDIPEGADLTAGENRVPIAQDGLEDNGEGELASAAALIADALSTMNELAACSDGSASSGSPNVESGSSGEPGSGGGCGGGDGRTTPDDGGRRRVGSESEETAPRQDQEEGDEKARDQHQPPQQEPPRQHQQRWDERTQRAQTQPRKTFVLVAKEHLVGTWLAVFVRASMVSRISDVRSGEARLKLT